MRRLLLVVVAILALSAVAQAEVGPTGPIPRIAVQ